MLTEYRVCSANGNNPVPFTIIPPLRHPHRSIISRSQSTRGIRVSFSTLPSSRTSQGMIHKVNIHFAHYALCAVKNPQRL